MGVRAARFLAVAATLSLLGAGNAATVADLHATATRYYADAATIARFTGRDATMDYYQRLLDDADLLMTAVPGGYPPDVWQQYASETSALDLSLAGQLLSRTYRPLASIRGLGETLVRSSKDGTMQPVAVYVPSSYSPAKPAALLVFLHGRLQSESSLIAPAFVTDLAERSNTIVIAPYGRGYYDFHPSETDVYDALDAAVAAFATDRRKTYLAGYSMGGFSVYAVAPIHPDRWSAIMSIAGALLGTRSTEVTAMLPRTPFYILTGALDTNIPTQYPTASAVFLRDSGVPVTFYSDAAATHRLYTLRGILAQAWSDMENGVVRTPVSLKLQTPLMQAPPPGMKT